MRIDMISAAFLACVVLSAVPLADSECTKTTNMMINIIDIIV